MATTTEGGSTTTTTSERRIESSPTTTVELFDSLSVFEENDSTISQNTPLSSLYPDTAPRSLWRPQMQNWLKRNHPNKLKEISQHCAPPKLNTVTVQTRCTTTTTTNTNNNNTNDSLTASHVDINLSTYNNNDQPLPIPIDKNQHHHSLQHGHSRKLLPTNHYDKPYSRPNFVSSSSSPSDKEFTTPIYHPILNPSPNYSTISPKLPSPPPDSPEENSISGAAASSSNSRRRCISCGSDQSPCWRPSWSTTAGQLCNSCGLRYKKTGARCISSNCGRIPAKGEWVTMKRYAAADSRSGEKLRYNCLSCGGLVEVGEKNDD